MDLFSILAVAEATKIKDRVKRVNIADYELFIHKSVFATSELKYHTKHKRALGLPYIYVVVTISDTIDFVSESYEEAIRYALTNFIHSINFQEK